MSLATAAFGLALLVTATVAAPVAAAVLAHREPAAAPWVRKRARWLWAAVACLWLLSFALKLARGATFPEIDLVASSLGFVAAVALAFLHRPDRQAQVP